ncbi:Retrovirus-related Pol polyprotein from transposon RE1 [Vitis vinifera]|uniref:Retrovirus-related Pol polyprotein from transposon RE1 n=2 Tax=Vitis vinifera TaxID=29760 RepID=A0A438DQV1_VITVI|nr:Retrovirus-related Pol polyprotein from transposon RE1 [Vitis vinifera]
MVVEESIHVIFYESNNSLQERESFDDDLGLETSMGKLQIEDRRQQEEVVEDPKKEESPLALPPPQQVQGESSQDLPKDWKFVINHPQDQIIEFSKCMHSEFEMSMMGELNFFLGLQIKQLKEGTFINQAKYIRDLLKRFNMEEAKTMKTPMSSSIKLDMDEKGKPVNSTMYRGMIGSLLYLTASRPDIMYSVCLCARFQSCPKESHLSAVKRILRYLKGTMDIGLWYPKGDNFELIGYSDADFAGCKVERKSTSGTCHFLGHSLVSWHSKKQNSVALSTAEAEYIAAGLCCAQILWMKQTLSDFNLIFEHVPIKCDNTSAINISKNLVQHSRTKHIEIRHHFLRDHAQKGDITLEFGFDLKPRVSAFGSVSLCTVASGLVQLHLRAPRASGWRERAPPGLRATRYEPSQPEQTGLAERRGMTRPSSVRRRLSAYKQKFAQRKVVPGRSVNFSQLQHFGFEGLFGRMDDCRCDDFEPIFSDSVCGFLFPRTYGLGGPWTPVYEAKAWPTMSGFSLERLVQRLCGLADAQGMGKPSAHNLTVPAESFTT